MYIYKFCILWIQISSDCKTRYYSDGQHKYSETNIKSMVGFFVDKIYVVFGDQVFQQYVGIPMGTNCAPSFRDLFFFIFIWIC
jgi:hypothetical protein